MSGEARELAAWLTVEHLDIGDWSSPEWRQQVRDAHAHLQSLK